MGTKWDVQCDEIEVLEDNPTKYVVRLDTAWSPPINWAKTVSDEFEIYFQLAYVECGCAYYGVTEIKYEESSCVSKVYDFALEDYKPIDPDDEDGEWVPGGNLKGHMDKYQLISVGG